MVCVQKVIINKRQRTGMSQEAVITEAEKQEARAKLKEKFGESTRTGGKGR